MTSAATRTRPAPTTKTGRSAKKSSPAKSVTKGVAKPAKKAVAKKAAPVVKKAVSTKAVVKKAVPVAKRPVAKKAAVKKVAVKKAAPVAAKKVATEAAPPAPLAVVVPVQRRRGPRPLVTKARRADGRALSYSERLAEAMHRQLAHQGPVCHRCRMNSSQLAALVPTRGRIAV